MKDGSIAQPQDQRGVRGGVEAQTRRNVTDGLLGLRRAPAAADRAQMFTNDSPLCAATTPSSVVLTFFQLSRAFIRPSQRCTLG